LTRLHGGSPTEVGIPLTMAALGWSFGSWIAGKPRAAAAPAALARAGFLVVSVGVASLVVLTWGGVSLWAAAPLWGVAGLGMGIGYPTVSVQLLQRSTPSEQGANSAALQVCDVIGSITGVAVAATLVTVAGHAHLAVAMRIADPLLAAGAVTGALLTARALQPPVTPGAEGQVRR
jgi:hypothetical protein